MKDSVVIKSNAYGLILYLDPQLPFERLREDVERKFARSARFFRGAQMALTFRGRELTEDEELSLVDAITTGARIQIVCIVDENRNHAEHDRQAMIRAIEDMRSGSALLYRGTLNNGQELHSDKNVVVLGDVNPGARVTGSGSVIILGCCMGEITAGAGGDSSSFVCALTLLPFRLKIAGHEAVSAIRKRENPGTYPVDPKIAYVAGGHILMEKMNGMSFEKAAALRAPEKPGENVREKEENGENAAGESAAEADPSDQKK